MVLLKYRNIAFASDSQTWHKRSFCLLWRTGTTRCHGEMASHAHGVAIGRDPIELESGLATAIDIKKLII